MLRAAAFSVLLLFQLLTIGELPTTAATHVEGAKSNDLEMALQAVVVTSQGWDDIHGTLQRYERDGKKWKKVGRPVPVVFGRAGLAWSNSKTEPDFIVLSKEWNVPSGPTKVEGDGRSPAGLFRFGTMFSTYESAYRYTHMPYILLTPTTECVDDQKSTHYNTVVDPAAEPTIKRDWDSSEHMLRHDNLYDIGITIGNNPHAVPGAGSCVFVHIQGPIGHYHGTAGCTALPADDMAQMFDWLNQDKHPILIQMPKQTYRAFKKKMPLP
jgi:D-alanyl-D-alanine dipeptidase